MDEVIKEPGIYYDLPFDEYLKIEAISKSALFSIDASEQSYLYAEQERIKSNEPGEQAKHFSIGRAIHTACLEPDRFDDLYCVAPVINKRTNAGKADWAMFLANAVKKGMGVLSAEEYEQVRGMGNSLRRHPRADDILSHGQAEVSIVDRDLRFDRLRKSRVDWLVDNEIIVDLKSTGRGADPHSVLMQIFDLGYYLQAGLYLDIASSQLKKQLQNFMFIFVESKAPHLVGIYRADDDMIDLGIRKYLQLMKKLERAESSGVWPHYNDDRITETVFLRWQSDKIKASLDVPY